MLSVSENHLRVISDAGTTRINIRSKAEDTAVFGGVAY